MRPSPLQNRVTPAGDIVAVAARGTMMGNRGILRDAATRTLGTARWRLKAWICCVLGWRGQGREVMRPGSYTELFFLDEATAMAAGHRPCAYCRRADFERFRVAWTAATGDADPRVRAIDDRLRRERVNRRWEKVSFRARCSDLHPGAGPGRRRT